MLWEPGVGAKRGRPGRTGTSRARPRAKGNMVVASTWRSPGHRELKFWGVLMLQDPFPPCHMGQ